MTDVAMIEGTLLVFALVCGLLAGGGLIVWGVMWALHKLAPRRFPHPEAW